MDEIKEEYLDSLPKFEGHSLIECFKLDEMQNHYEIMTKTSHYEAEEVEAMCRTRNTLRRKGYAYAMTVEIKGYTRFFHLWVEGVEKRVINAEINKSTRLNGVPV